MNAALRREYVRAVLDAYRTLVGQHVSPRAADRRLAGELFQRGIPLRDVTRAILLGVVRRRIRPADAAPLAPIGSLHYFLPVLNEIRQIPLTDDYVRYLGSVAARQLDQPVVGDSPEFDVFR